MPSHKCAVVGSSVLGVLGVGLVACGIFLPGFVDDLKEEGIREQTIRTREDLESSDPSDGMRWWLDNSAEDANPTFQSVYMYNITNARDYINEAGNVAELQEKGPYTYRKYSKKYNATWMELEDRNGVNREAIRYFQQTWYVWDAENSCDDCKEDDVFTQLNVPHVGASTNPGLGSTVLLAFCAETDDYELMFTQQTAKDLIFGYEFMIGGFIQADHPGVLSNMTEEDAYEAGWYTMSTGESNKEFTYDYMEFEDMETHVSCPDFLECDEPPTEDQIAPTWNSTFANRIEGTDGTQFERDLSAGVSLEAFVSDVGRTVQLDNAGGEIETVRGIDLLKMTPTPTALMNSTLYPPNADFYMNSPSGAFDITRLRGGVPVHVSLPHFLNADPVYASRFGGLNADPALHELYISVEPQTGLTMNAHKRSQVNFKITPLTVDCFLGPTRTFFPHVLENSLMPFVWMDENGGITERLANEFKDSISFAETARAATLYGGFAGGALCILIAGVLIFTKRPKEDGQDTQPGYQTLPDDDRKSSAWSVNNQ